MLLPTFSKSPFYLKKDSLYALPCLHYNMEFACEVRRAFLEIQPDCVAVELPVSMQLQFLHAASRLPDISVISYENMAGIPSYYSSEPCDASFEALRSAMEQGVPAFCIDLDVDDYPDHFEPLPDPYSIKKIGFKTYFELFERSPYSKKLIRGPLDTKRELFMAKSIKELQLRYEKVLFVGGFFHVEAVMQETERSSFPSLTPAPRNQVQIATLTEGSAREVMAEYGWIAEHFEKWRKEASSQTPLLDRQKLIYQLYKAADVRYVKERAHSPMPGYAFRNIMKFARNQALLSHMLLPDLHQILLSAKGCQDHNFAYEVWELATTYSLRKNIDSLNELSLSCKDVWKKSARVQFHLKDKHKKQTLFPKKRKDRNSITLYPPSPFAICSYPKEDVIIEEFGQFLRKKGKQIVLEDSASVIPFTTSIEDGIDIKETLHHWHEKKLYVKVRGKPQGDVGSVVVVFDEDSTQKKESEKYAWKTTWLGEHNQESDMAFYATPMTENMIGPGISKCSYGGFFMSYPPRRLFDIWTDPDYYHLKAKPDVLLTAAIDYALQPFIIYVSKKAPPAGLKLYASRFGKKIIYLPMNQLAKPALESIRTFHVLDGRDKRTIADEYIF